MKFTRWLAGGKSWQDYKMAETLDKIIDLIEKLPEEYQRDMACVVYRHFEDELKK